MTKRRVLLACLVLAFLGATIVIFRSLPGTEASAPSDPPSPELTGLTVEPSARTARPLPRFDPNGVPAPTTPLPPVAALLNRANAGDARAACQLAAELHQCREQATLARGQPKSAPPATQRCAQLLERHLDQHFAWLRQAAFAGEPEAMLRYALGEAFGMPGDSYAFLRSADFDTWRREAPAMLQALFEAGYPEVLVHLVISSRPLMGGQLGNLLPPDPVRERAYLELLAMLSEGGGEAAMLKSMLANPVDPAVLDQSRALAARWKVSHFPATRLPAGGNPSGHRVRMMHASGQACSQLADEATP